MLHMLLPSFHHPRTGALASLALQWPGLEQLVVLEVLHHQNLVDFLECIYIILNMDFSMVDLMSKEWGDCFAFFFHQKWSGVVILKPRTSKNYFLNMITILCWMGVKIQTFKHWFAAQKHGGRVIVFAGDPLNLDKVNQDRIRTEIQKIQHDTCFLLVL